MKRKISLLISALVGSAYFAYIVYYMNNTLQNNTGSSAEQLGTGIGVALIMPHAALAGLAVLFNWLGFALNARWAALTGAILYCVAGLFMPIYLPFVLLQIVLSFVGFARIKK